MLTLLAAYPRSAWRIRGLFADDGRPGPPIALSQFTIARVDGGPSSLSLSALIAIDTSYEFSTSEPMLLDVPYILTYTAGNGGTANVLFTLAPNNPQRALPPDDPEAEIFGVDLDIWYGVPGPDGDAQQRRGQPCLVHDLKALAMINKGELVHLPNRGGGMLPTVNATASPDELDAARGTLAAEFATDDRVADVSVTVSADPDDEGEFDYDARVVPVGTGRPLRVSNT